MKRLLFIGLLIGIFNQASFAQDKKAKFGLEVFKDSLDGQLDMSRFLIEYHGFIPLAQLITEPALGGIGGMLTPIFIQPNKYQDSTKYVAPDITAAFGGYTRNKSWFVGGMRIASLPKHKLKYRIGVAHGDVNMDFYRVLPVVGEQKFGFNFQASGIFGSIMRELGNSDLYLGLDYLFARNRVSANFDQIPLPDFVKDKDLDSNLSSLGLTLDFDKRDNLFTPNQGWYLAGDFLVNDSWTGSDYSFHTLNFSVFNYQQFGKQWVSGLRLQTKIQGGDAPFYLKPAINARGVPMSRYQGDAAYTLETEQRYDFTRRWSGLVFAGISKAPSEDISFGDAESIVNYGTGFRYLIARKFKIRTGIDVAWSKNDFGWYIVFGSAWNNRN
ncbi:BamA/TamA family outer membrane protein [Algoriphagus vanfongensis]|uniref:BamA/TamA family outer membrane protein n=1 Tax=Algoriphagus vanfongensis TaxID=426371 RepID=UPI0003F84903|nr:BamA/TamA family outer membrane protein [Algoriphagus vanfongensis]